MARNADNVLKIIELLGRGFDLKFQRSRAGRRAIYEDCDRIWHSIDRKQLYQTLDRLKLRGVVKAIKQGDNLERMMLTDRARFYSLHRQFKAMSSLKRPSKWDKKWRIVLFDIPEKMKNKRNALREKLKTIGFLEFQKSIFVYPFFCRDEIQFIINFLEISEYVYYIEAPIVPDRILKKHFQL